MRAARKGWLGRIWWVRSTMHGMTLKRLTRDFGAGHGSFERRSRWHLREYYYSLRNFHLVEWSTHFSSCYNWWLMQSLCYHVMWDLRFLVDKCNSARVSCFLHVLRRLTWLLKFPRMFGRIRCFCGCIPCAGTCDHGCLWCWCQRPREAIGGTGGRLGWGRPRGLGWNHSEGWRHVFSKTLSGRQKF